MTEKPAALIRQALSCYRKLPLMVRFHNYVRHKTCPFDRIEPWVPQEGMIYDLGCGHGLFSIYLALSSRTRRIVGSDSSEDKIAAAILASHTISNVEFRQANILNLPMEMCDAVIILDVLYLMNHEQQEKIIERCRKYLRPGGLLIVTATDTRPRWKYLWAYFQELLAVRLFRITTGYGLCFRPGGEFTSLFAKIGFEAHSEKIDRGYVYPHLLFICKKKIDVGVMGQKV